MADISKVVLSSHVRDAIDQWLLRYPPERKRSAVLEALHFAQADNQGHLTEEIMNAVADYLEIPPIAVYEVASFYSMYNLKPVGRHVINVCSSISCALSDSEKILCHLHQRLGIGLNETTADGKFTLREVECLAACANAPVAHVGQKYYENLTPEKVDAMLGELR
jgi:NADH-quinone oxidoreductase subunit E